jgi:GTP cyclohydrolase IA
LAWLGALCQGAGLSLQEYPMKTEIGRARARRQASDDVVPSKRQRMRPSREEAEAAVRTLIEWAGDDPSRAGLRGTPDRVVRSYEEFFSGYDTDPVELLQRTFDEIDGYDEMVVLRGVRFESRCEHHLAPIVGRAWVAYVPDGRVVGSASSRAWLRFMQGACSSRSGSRHRSPMSSNRCSSRAGSAFWSRQRYCMTARGVHKPEADLVTSRMIGCLRDHSELRREFLSMTA